MTAGTLFHKTRTDLRKWLLAIWLLASMKKPPSAAELSRQLGATRKTGWLLRRKITHAMRRGEHELLLFGVVELDALTGAADAMIRPGSAVRTDGWRSYWALPAAGYIHEPYVQSTPQSASELLPWAHIVISNFKRWRLDVFHGVSAAHLHSYLDEFYYRLNRRDQRLDLFRRILNRCVLYTPPTAFTQLIGRAA